MVGVLIRYNRRNGDRFVKVFDKADDAMNDKGFRKYMGKPDPIWETAIIMSDSLESVKHTHSRYFSGVDRTQELSASFN
ncbi:hypothetical protein [Bifidobacterium sp. SO1]|uniref:hypothetical protein n=1 Tax=Bifidobacterium sp. SO1 TaxID=2809029 RepID=UPI001BDD6F77|nr:hypothetical protein [Bifidobacterium sp. SO1]MBT1162946.1 hypothetical protein [Bifidobacterium sp. SO1]